MKKKNVNKRHALADYAASFSHFQLFFPVLDTETLTKVTEQWRKGPNRLLFLSVTKVCRIKKEQIICLSWTKTTPPDKNLRVSPWNKLAETRNATADNRLSSERETRVFRFFLAVANVGRSFVSEQSGRCKSAEDEGLG